MRAHTDFENNTREVRHFSKNQKHILCLSPRKYFIFLKKFVRNSEPSINKSLTNVVRVGIVKCVNDRRFLLPSVIENKRTATCHQPMTDRYVHHVTGWSRTKNKGHKDYADKQNYNPDRK